MSREPVGRNVETHEKGAVLLDIEVSRRKANLLRALHHGEGLLLLPNAWDCASARVFEDCGFLAIATTSAGVAWALGYPDGERLGLDEMAGAVSRVSGAVTVPVTADVEAGYGDSPQEAAETARAVIQAGAVGLNLEDAADAEPPAGRVGLSGKAGSFPLLGLEEQFERIRAVVEAGGEAGVPLVVNARTDVYWRAVGDPERRLAQAVRRASAYLEAGADCVFVPGVTDPRTIAALAREIPGPLNVLAGPGALPIDELAGLGVRRVSVGSAPARAAMGLARVIGRELLQAGTYRALGGDALPYAEANALFEGNDLPNTPNQN